MSSLDLVFVSIDPITTYNTNNPTVSVCVNNLDIGLLSKTKLGKGFLTGLPEWHRFLWRIDTSQTNSMLCI